MLTFLLDLFATTCGIFIIIMAIIFLILVIEAMWSAYMIIAIILVASFIFAAWSLRKKYKIEKVGVNND